VKGDISYLSICLTGENGEVECNADRVLTVSVDGGELLAFGSANPRTEESFLSGSYPTYYGKSLAAVRLTGENARVTVRGGGLDTITAVLRGTD